MNKSDSKTSGNTRIIEMYIVEKEKLSFIRGDSHIPIEKNDGYKK